MMYGDETWAVGLLVKKAQENKLDVAEMRMVKMGEWSHQAGQN